MNATPVAAPPLAVRREPDVSLLQAIGNTPLVDVSALLAGDAQVAPGVRLLAKLEGHNPTGSVKDRIAVAMVRNALETGELSRGQTLLEPTSGNTGISLAMVASLVSCRLRAVMPDNATPERVQLLRLFGAEVVFSDGAFGSNGAVRMAQQLAADDPSLYMPMQYENPLNPQAHYDTTAVELLEQTGGKIDAFVAGLGTGGTLMGVARRLREHDASTQIVAAEPRPGDPVMGLRSLEDGYIPPILDPTKLDRRILVGNGDSVRAMRALASVGVFAGVSAGGALHVARRIAREAASGQTVVVLVADSGWKYLSAGLWHRDVDELERDMETGHWW